MQKAAVVIGVNKTGDLPVLSAAASGASKVGDWLRKEGFQVQSFTDGRKPVLAGDVFMAVSDLVERGTLRQLVVYFSGHGFLNNGSEHWMLSGAPNNPNEAISMAESVLLARECGIPSVVFISDACRSTPASLRAERVRGSLIFPNQPVAAGVGLEDVEVDRFFATLPGEPALEMPLDESAGQYEGIYTTCFLNAFRKPDQEMIRSVNLNGRTIRVVPNRSLKRYLKREVNQLAQAKSIKLRQLPRSIVESDDTCYLGRVAKRRGPPAQGPRPAVAEAFSVSDVARLELAGAVGDAMPAEASAIRGTDAQSGFDAAMQLVGQADTPRHFETETGFAVTGAEVASAVGVQMRAELLTPGATGQSALIRMYPGDSRAGSLVLRFADGSGTVLAALDGYIGSVVVDGGAVVNVSYMPSDNNWRWPDYEQHRPHLERLRARVAAAARYGVFQVEREQAGRIADEIRYMKSIDPTLGLYAAYAYSDAGLRQQVRSVRGYMRDDLQADLFDVAMLADVLSPTRHPERAVPFCPMLSQGWGLLRVKRVRLPPALAPLDDLRRPALWTTFEPAGMDLIEQALPTGALI